MWHTTLRLSRDNCDGWDVYATISTRRIRQGQKEAPHRLQIGLDIRTVDYPTVCVFLLENPKKGEFLLYSVSIDHPPTHTPPNSHYCNSSCCRCCCSLLEPAHISASRTRTGGSDPGGRQLGHLVFSAIISQNVPAPLCALAAIPPDHFIAFFISAISHFSPF